MGFVLVSQLITFVILARHLGNTQFGQLMAITAATQIAIKSVRSRRRRADDSPACARSIALS